MALRERARSRIQVSQGGPSREIALNGTILASSAVQNTNRDHEVNR